MGPDLDIISGTCSADFEEISPVTPPPEPSESAAPTDQFEVALEQEATEPRPVLAPSVFLCQYDPVLYESAADPNSPEGVEVNLRRLTSGDDTLQQVSREELKQAYILHASLDPTFEENAVLIAAQTLSEDPVVNAAGWEAARHEPTLLAWVTQLQTAVAVQLAASGSEGRDFLTAIARATRDTTVQKKIIQILVNTHPRVIRPARQQRESPSQPRQRTPRFVIHASASALPPFEIFNRGVAVATPFILELPLTLRPREVELTSSGRRDRDLEPASTQVAAQIRFAETVVKRFGQAFFEQTGETAAVAILETVREAATRFFITLPGLPTLEAVAFKEGSTPSRALRLEVVKEPASEEGREAIRGIRLGMVDASPEGKSGQASAIVAAVEKNAAPEMLEGEVVTSLPVVFVPIGAVPPLREPQAQSARFDARRTGLLEFAVSGIAAKEDSYLQDDDSSGSRGDSEESPDEDEEQEEAESAGG